MILSFKYRIYPNKTQNGLLRLMFYDFCVLYNAGLQQRREAWDRQKTNRNFTGQAAELVACRESGVGLERWSYSAEEQVLRRLDKAFQAFFSRIKSGSRPGFPRFRASARYHSADFRVGDGLTIRKTGRIGIVGIPGEIKVKWHRALPSKPKSAIVTRQGDRWFIVFHVEVDAAAPRDGETVGLDCGLTTLAALSNGEIIQRPNQTKRSAKGLRRRQRALSRCKRGSKRRKKARANLARFQDGIANRRRDHLHKVSADLVCRFSDIAIEDLNIRGLAASMLAKAVNDAAWGQLISMLNYKAEKAGGRVVKVDPRGTSQTCPRCQIVKPKTLDDRVHRCECGCVLDRDVAAAMVIHQRAFPLGPGTGLQSLSRALA